MILTAHQLAVIKAENSTLLGINDHVEERCVGLEIDVATLTKACARFIPFYCSRVVADCLAAIRRGASAQGRRSAVPPGTQVASV